MASATQPRNSPTVALRSPIAGSRAGSGAGRADSVLIDPADFPGDMRADIERWRDRFPLTFALVERLYREERGSG